MNSQLDPNDTAATIAAIRMRVRRGLFPSQLGWRFGVSEIGCTDGWIEYDCPRTATLAREQARGCYQLDFLAGHEAISGSTLRGKARKYSIHYATSRNNLLTRCARAGLVVTERRGAHNKRIVCIEQEGA